MLVRKLVVGLGNPGARYQKTRHNIGFLTLEQGNFLGQSLKFKKPFFSKDLSVSIESSECEAHFLLPQTYMNLSGRAITRYMKHHRIDPEHLLVVSDDLDLPLGKVRLRLKGSSGGHQGLESIKDHIQTDDFRRLKLGIGKPDHTGKTVDYVLEKFMPGELPVLERVLDIASTVVNTWLREGDAAARNELSRILGDS